MEAWQEKVLGMLQPLCYFFFLMVTNSKTAGGKSQFINSDKRRAAMQQLVPLELQALLDLQQHVKSLGVLLSSQEKYQSTTLPKKLLVA